MSKEELHGKMSLVMEVLDDRWDEICKSDEVLDFPITTYTNRDWFIIMKKTLDFEFPFDFVETALLLVNFSFYFNIFRDRYDRFLTKPQKDFLIQVTKQRADEEKKQINQFEINHLAFGATAFAFFRRKIGSFAGLCDVFSSNGSFDDFITQPEASLEEPLEIIKTRGIENIKKTIGSLEERLSERSWGCMFNYFLWETSISHERYSIEKASNSNDPNDSFQKAVAKVGDLSLYVPINEKFTKSDELNSFVQKKKKEKNDQRK